MSVLTVIAVNGNSEYFHVIREADDELLRKQSS